MTRFGNGLEPVPPLSLHRVEASQGHAHAVADPDPLSDRVGHLEGRANPGREGDDRDIVSARGLHEGVELGGLGSWADRRDRLHL
jgi:hypothetical protein